jgi:hypothetical protein
MQKKKFKNGESLVICDFSENYAFVGQDAAQGLHWNNSQATIHPFVIYYKKEQTGVIDHINYIIISNCTKHDDGWIVSGGV